MDTTYDIPRRGNVSLTRTPAPPERFLSEATCAALAQRIEAFASGGGDTALAVETAASGTIRFARNEIRTSTDVRNNTIRLSRTIAGATGTSTGNQIDDLSLLAMVRRAERELTFYREGPGRVFQPHWASDRMSSNDSSATDPRLQALIRPPDPILHPKLFFESTERFDAASRAAAIEPLVANAKRAGMLAAGFINTTAEGIAMISTYGRDRYYPFSRAEYTVTVRSPDGTASGWAGVNWNDWNRVDGVGLSEMALDKCLRSRNPVLVEPGRYTVILEPQAVFDLFKYVYEVLLLLPQGRLFDKQITVSHDPMDPDCGEIPFDAFGNAIHAETYIDRGMWKGVKSSGGSFRMHGGSATLDGMIASTQRGLYISRFSNITRLNQQNLLLSGYTRDGTWLVEGGKITKAVKNLKFTDSPLFAFNKVGMVGEARRVYSVPVFAAVVPAVKISEFAFTGTTNAV